MAKNSLVPRGLKYTDVVVMHLSTAHIRRLCNWWTLFAGGKNLKKKEKSNEERKIQLFMGELIWRKKNVLCKDIEIENYIQGCCRFQNILPVLATFDLYIWYTGKPDPTFFWFEKKILDKLKKVELLKCYTENQTNKFTYRKTGRQDN